MKDGSVILMHDIHDTTVEAVEPILKYLQAEEYEMVTLSECTRNNLSKRTRVNRSSGFFVCQGIARVPGTQTIQQR